MDAQTIDRDVNRNPHGAAADAPLERGINYLLIIGIDKYKHFGRLFNAKRDATDFASLLIDHYLFDPEHVHYLLDEEATNDNIYATFSQLTQILGPTDSLVIYFSGHGLYDQQLEVAYWIPVDARDEKPADYFPNDRLISSIKAIKSRHTFIIADACYSGSLFVSNRDISRTAILEKDPSRWMFASGRDKPVSDGVFGKNSPFSEQLLNVLYRYKNEGIRITSLIEKVVTATIYNSFQEPIGRPIQNAGDQGGEFIFHPRYLKSSPIDENSVKDNTSYPGLRENRLKLWQQYPKIFQAAIYLILVIPFAYWFLQPKGQVQAKMELLLDQVQFQNFKQASLLYDSQIPRATFKDFSSVEIIADSINTDLEGIPNYDGQISLANPLILESEEISPILTMDSAIFDALYLPKASQMSMFYDTAISDQLQLWYNDFEEQSISLQFQNQLDFVAQNVMMYPRNQKSEEIYSFNGYLGLVPGKIGKINILQHDASCSISIALAEEQNISGKNLRVALNDNSFTKIDNETRVSSIKKGEIQILNHIGDSAIRKIILDSNELIFIAHNETIELSSLAIAEGSLKLGMYGTVKAIQTGADERDRIPSRLWWYWNTRKLEMIFLGLCLFGLLMLVGTQKLTILWELFVKLIG